MSADLDVKPVVDVKPDIDVKPKVEQDELQQLPTKIEEAEPTLKQESDGESELDTAHGSPSPSRSPSPEQVKRSSKKNGKKAEQHPVQLIGDLPRAEADALRTFMELRQCEYQNARIGRSRNLEEGFACECKDSEHGACGPNSDCINRLTQIECLESECRPSCLNQRFEKRQFADIHVVKTEMKGFGLRAATDLDKDAFVYEYLGEIVDTARFTKRMKQYADEGIRHFYFMMLQKDEFIDATKKGGLGRFANHSCNPNCYVAKWTVGKRVRMGIFTSRAVKKDEELTFNYNVDRYGHEAQTCYCGEPNCVGSIGGKTQTDVATLDDLYLDALGISEEVELLGLKGNKKTKGRKLGVDYMPELKPLIKEDMVKIVQALRQASSRKVVERLLGRIKTTDDGPTFREGMRLRILSALGSLFDEWSEDCEMKVLVVEALESVTSACISTAKLDASKIEAPVKAFLEDEQPSLKAAAERLLEKWKQLPGYYRIRKLTAEEQEARKRFDEEQLYLESLKRPLAPFPSYQYATFGSPIPGSGTPTPPLGTPIARPIPTGPRATPTGPRAPPTGPRASGSRSASMSTIQRIDGQEPPAKRQRIAFLHSEEPHLLQQMVKPAPSQEEVHVANLLAQRAARIAQEEQTKKLQRMINEDAAKRQPEVVAVPTGITQAAVADGMLLPAPGTVPDLARPRLTDAEIEERAQKRLAARKAKKDKIRAKEAKEERKRKKEAAAASVVASGSNSEKDTLEMRQLHFKKLVTAVVVKVMGKYQKHLTRDQFKDNAKSITEKIYASELKKFGDRADKYKALDEKQTDKMKGFIKSSMEAAIHKIKKQAKQEAAAASASAAAASTTAAEDGTPSTATDQTGPATPPDDVAMDWDTQGADFMSDLNKELVPESKPAPQFDEPDEEDDASDKDDGEDDDAMDVDPEDEMAINAAVEAAEKAQRDAEDGSTIARSTSDPRRLAQLQQAQTVSASAS